MIFMKIALRNIFRNRKRSLLIAVVFTLSCTFLLMSYAVGTGIGRQIIRTYRDTQSGDVTVVWSNVKEIDPSDPSRLFFSDFDIRRDVENRTSMARLEAFLESHAGEIERIVPTVHEEGLLDTGTYAAFSIIRGVTREEFSYLRARHLLKLVAGEPPYGEEYGILVSDRTARENGIYIGDWVVLDGETVHGYVNTLDFRVTGVYRSSSEYDGVYVYMGRENALSFLDQDPLYFRTLKIYLKHAGEAEAFARRLDSYLIEGNAVLRAEAMRDSSAFYFSIAGFQKKLFTFFVLFVYFVIAAGIRSAVRMSLFERMREFGTLRAIGFGRFRNFFLAVTEVLLLSLASLAAALVLSAFLVLIFARTGIPVGPGAIAYAIGGESIYPGFEAADILAVLFIVVLFSLFAPLKPGLRISFQRITDLLARRQRPVFAAVELMRALKRSGRRKSDGEER